MISFVPIDYRWTLSVAWYMVLTTTERMYDLNISIKDGKVGVYK